MSHLTESLNDLLEPNFTASDNSYKKGRRGYQNHKPISFSCRQLPSAKEERQYLTNDLG